MSTCKIIITRQEYASQKSDVNHNYFHPLSFYQRTASVRITLQDAEASSESAEDFEGYWEVGVAVEGWFGIFGVFWVFVRKLILTDYFADFGFQSGSAKLAIK